MVKFNGPLFALPAGNVRAAIGGERNKVRNYNINGVNRPQIAGPDVFGAFFNPLTYPNYLGYADFIVPIDYPAGCVNGDTATYDPVLAEYAGRTVLYGGGIQNACGVEVLLDARNTNLAATKQDGIDAQVHYLHPIREGSVFFDLNVNKVLSNQQQVNPGDPFVDRAGFYSSPIEWRGRGAVGVNYRDFSATLFANYTGSYTNDRAVDALNRSINPVKVGAYTTFDLNLGYSDPGLRGESGRLVKSLRESLSIQNITDKAPRIVYTSGSVFSPAYSNPFGRTVTFQIAAGF